jgi:hypothetical protein
MSLREKRKSEVRRNLRSMVDLFVASHGTADEIAGSKSEIANGLSDVVGGRGL